MALVHEVKLSGAGDGLGAAGDLKLAVDRVDIPLYGAYRDDKLVRDLAIGATGGDEPQHGYLALAEWLFEGV